MGLKHWTWMTGLVAALVATPAYSQRHDAGDVYLGAALGYHVAPDAEDEAQSAADERTGAGTLSVSVDDGALGWGVYGGYFLADTLAVEIGYLDNADMEVGVRVRGGGEIKVDWSTSAFYGAVVAHIPVSDGASVSPFVKAGMVRWEGEYSSGEPGVEFEDGDGTDLLFGGGVDFPINETASIRGEWMMLLIEDDHGGAQHRFQVGVNFAL